MSHPAVQRIVDALPPRTWDATVWVRTERGGRISADTYVNGRLDPADVHRIIRRVLDLLHGLRVCDSCGAPVLTACHDTGNPLHLDPMPDPQGWLAVWDEDGITRVSGTAEHPDARRYSPHRCSPVAG